MIRCTLSWLAKLSPWLVIASLAYAAAFIQPTADEEPLPQPLLETRDRFFGGAGNDQLSWFVGGDGVLLETPDQGLHWQRETLGAGNNLQSTAVSPDGVRVVVGNGAQVFVNRIGTEQWEQLSLPMPDYANKLFDVRFLGDSFWIVGEVGSVFRLDADGREWTARGLEEDMGINAITRDERGRLWLAAEFGLLLYSDDEGASWQRMELSEESLRMVAFSGEQGVVVGNRGQVLISADAGESWTRLADLGSEHLYDVIHYQNRWLITGEQGQLFAAERPAGPWLELQPDGIGKTYFMRFVQLPSGLAMAGKHIGLIDDGAWVSWPRGE